MKCLIKANTAIRFISLLLFAAIFAISCEKSEPKGGEDDKKEPTKEEKVEFTSGTDLNPVVPTIGGGISITFNASTSWTASAINVRSDSWCSVSPTSGSAGNATITITTKENTEPDERSASVIIKAGSTSKTIKVTQKQKDALTVTASTFEVPADGKDINIEVKANIDVTYKIAEDSKEWIKYVSTKAIKTSALTFAVSKNEKLEKREGRIIIGEGALSDTIKIFQAGETPSILLNKNEYIAKSQGETFALDVASNVDVNINIVHPDSTNTWLQESSTKTMSTNTYYFTAAANESPDSREAKIIFTNKENNLADTVTVTQLQKDAIVLAKNEYKFGVDGGTLDFDIQTNVDVTVEISEEAKSWLTHISTKALQTKSLSFAIAACEESQDRTGTITLKGGDVEQKITITQTGRIPNNQIWYTSSDNTVITPTTPDAFGATIISNTYHNGKGIITFDKPITTVGEKAFHKCLTLTSVTIPAGITSIGKQAFDECKNLASAIIPDGVTSIGKWAFSVCSNLTSITLPESIKILETGAFDNCSSLTSITIPEGVTTIGSQAFSYCYKLASVTIPESVNAIGYSAFYGCDNLVSINLPEGLSTIGQSVFYGCLKLSSITIPKNVTFIGSSAFGYCTGLSIIDIPQSVTDIAGSAFVGCPNLKFTGKFASSDGTYLIKDGTLIAVSTGNNTSYTVPDCVTAIGEYAFYNCYMLSSISIPESVKTIGAGAFYGCSSLSSITLPKGITTIGSYAFGSCSSLYSIEIPEGVTEIENGTFSNCSKLYSVTLPESITTIRRGAFWKCTNLRTLKIPQNVSTLEDYTFYECSYLTSIEIPNSITCIYENTFFHCTDLEYIVIPESVTEIKNEAFCGCSSLKSITLPKNLTNIEHYAFTNCTALSKIYVNSTTPPTLGNLVFDSNVSDRLFYVPAESVETYKNAESWSSYKDAIVENPTQQQDLKLRQIEYTSSDNSVVIPYNISAFGDATIISNTYTDGKGIITFDKPVTTIGKYAFQRCSNLTSITLPDNIDSIGSGAFDLCEKLASINIPDKVTAIDESNPFKRCPNLKFTGKFASSDGKCLIKNGVLIAFSPGTEDNDPITYSIPDSVTSIGKYAFSWCSGLTTIAIPNSITSIGYGAFYNCSGLTSITIPNSVTSIGKYAFAGCSNLSSFTIPENVTSIETGTFNGCSNLLSINIPNNINYIGGSVFSGCSSLTSITIPNGIKAIENYTFSGCSSLVSILIPESVTSIGQYAFSGCSKLSSITIPQGVTSIEQYTFQDCSKLISVSLPTNLTTIGMNAFRNCTSLTSIVIPSSVTQIKGAAFYGCTNLSSVNIPNGITLIDDWTFGYCANLNSITIPNSVATIGYRAFYQNTNLKSISIPANITDIGRQAFAECSNLNTVYCTPATPPSLGDTTGNEVFYLNASDRLIHVSRASVEAYKAAAGWSDYKDAIVGDL